MYEDSRDGDVDLPPLGPHQQQEIRQRVLHAAAAQHWEEGQDWLQCTEGLDAARVRAVFFAELRAVLRASGQRH